MKRYLEPIKRFAGVIIGAVIIGLVFPLLTQGLPEETRTSVLMQAVPFVAFFVAILLTFILLIVLSAMRFNGKVAPRTYRPIEYVIILGIIGGVFALFQSFHFVGYKYGFVMLLGATLCFILWSHVVPASAKADLQLPPFSLVHHLIGAAAGLVVVAVLVSSAVAANAPKEPYGIRQRVWNSYDDAKKQEISSVALADFNNVEMPFLVIFNLLPGLIVYFAVREIANALLSQKQATGQILRPAPGAGRA